MVAPARHRSRRVGARAAPARCPTPPSAWRIRWPAVPPRSASRPVGMARLFEARCSTCRCRAAARRAGRGARRRGRRMRRLLHQFAAGFLKEPAEETLQALRDVAALRLPDEPAREHGRAASRRRCALDVDVGAEVSLDDSGRRHRRRRCGRPRPVPDLRGRSRRTAAAARRRPAPVGAAPGTTAPRASMLRTLHTLKGSARLAGAMRLGELAHRMESEIESLERRGCRCAGHRSSACPLRRAAGYVRRAAAADTAAQADLAQGCARGCRRRGGCADVGLCR